MEKELFIKEMKNHLEKTGMSEGAFNSYFSIDDKKNINTTIYVDENNCIWLTPAESIKRIKTSINVENVVEFRYSQFANDAAVFFVICNDGSGLNFCEGEIFFFDDGYFGDYKNAFEWFAKNPVE